MELNFRMRNLAVNTFKSYLENDHIGNYATGISLYNRSRNDTELDTFGDYLDYFDQEIKQTIHSSNQDAIDTLFFSLIETLDYCSTIDLTYLLNLIDEYNIKAYQDFIKSVAEKEEEYFRKEEVEKYDHLEKYDTYPLNYFLSRGSRLNKITVTNYKYYCIELGPELVDSKDADIYIDFIFKTRDDLVTLIDYYIRSYNQGSIKARTDKFFEKILVYVEGDLDIKFITRAATLLDREHILSKIDLIDYEGYTNITKLWRFYKDHPSERTPQRKIFLYDCDTKIEDEDLGTIYRRILPFQPEHPVLKGIENLFDSSTIDKASQHKNEFIDISIIIKKLRGKETQTTLYEINKDEKTNFCNWLCEQGTVDDFRHFEILFKMIGDIINK